MASIDRGVRPTQRERSDQTIGDLLNAARENFAVEGFAGTSLDAVAERAGVSKGALYHHFRNKQDLFRAVYEREAMRLAALTNEAARSRPDDPWEGLFEGCCAFFRACLDSATQRICVHDALSVLGWEGQREASEELIRGVRSGVNRAIKAGRIAQRPPEPLTEFLYGAVSAGAMAVDRAPDQEATLIQTLSELRSIFDALRTST